MKDLFGMINILSDSEMDFIHDKSLELLKTIGMNIDGKDLRGALLKKGAKVDCNRVIFPEKLIEETIMLAKRNSPANKSGILPKDHLFSWHTFDVPREREPMCSFGGACLNILDGNGEARVASVLDMASIARVGEALDIIKSVGNPVVCSLDDAGNEIDSRLKTVTGVSILAKHSTKWGEAEVWSERELDFILEICCLLCGGMENYKKAPFFISPKDPITPLVLEAEACEVFTALAKRGIASTIISVPIAGATNTINPVGSIVVSNAEILGTMAAILAINDETPVCGGTIAGVMNMKTTNVDYSAPEAILADMGLHCLHSRRYGLNAGVGTGYFDAKQPGVQSGIDSAVKMLFSAACGKVSYPAGMVDSGKTFSPVQAMIDLDTAKYISTLMYGFSADEKELMFDEITEQGISGNFLDTDGTLFNYKNNWIPQVFSRSGSQDVLKNAQEKWDNTLKQAPETTVPDSVSREIDKIVSRARKELLR